MTAKRSKAHLQKEEAAGYVHVPETHSLNPKPPRQFTGHGLEIIGNPNDLNFECASLVFQDGNFASIGLPTRSLILSADPNLPPESQSPKRRASVRRYMAKALAEKLAKDPTDESAEVELKRILKECRNAKPRERAIENAIRKIRSGDFSENWSFQNLRGQLAVQAVIETAREYGRPPTEDEVIDWMKSVPAPNGGKLITDGERKHLAKLLRESGFCWLERSPRGRPRTS